MHALGALAERDDYVLVVLIRVCLRALWWHLPQCLWRPVLALWCVYQSACKVASYLLGAIVSVLKALGKQLNQQIDSLLRNKKNMLIIASFFSTPALI